MEYRVVCALCVVLAVFGCCSARTIIQPSLAAQEAFPASAGSPQLSAASTNAAVMSLPRRVAAGGTLVQSATAVDTVDAGSTSATTDNSTLTTTGGTQQQAVGKPSTVITTAAQEAQPLPVVTHPVPAAGQHTRPQDLIDSMNAPARELGTLLNGTKFIPGACGTKPSSLGYQCSWAGPQGVVLHWSHNVSHPPINRCTSNNAAPNAEARNNVTWLGDIGVHFALQVATKEKLHLGFVGPALRYYPSEGVHTGMYCSDTRAGCDPRMPQVEISYHASPNISVVTGNRALRDPSMMEGWAAWASSDFDELTGVLCFSRRADSTQSKVAPKISDSVMLSYAVNGRTPYTYKAPRLGIVQVDFKAGSAALVKLPYAAIRAHLLLLLLTFAVLIPAGLLSSRHSWLFVDDKKDTGLSPFWTLVHVSLLSVGALMGSAGVFVGMAIVGFSNTLDSAQQLWSCIAVGLSWLLVALSALRPRTTTAPGQGNPLVALLQVAGPLTVAAGWIAVFLGCMAARDDWAIPLKHWVPPCCIVCGLMTMVTVALELRYQKLVRTGQYNPRTHTLCNTNPLPLARIRTHREPFNSKKEDLLAPNYAYSDKLDKSGVSSATGSSYGGLSPSSKGVGAMASKGLVHILAAAEGRMSSSGGSTPSSVTYRGRANSSSGVISGFPSHPSERMNENV